MSTFLDNARISVKAGKGGDGMVAFRREKFVPDGGPAGGDGGRGGDIIFQVDEGLHTLMDFRYNRHFRAQNGENGMSKSKYGADAEDLIVKVPPGTVVRDAMTDRFITDLTDHGSQVIIAKGGRGGRGNKRFATHKNPAPSIAENGEPGQELELTLELKLIADVGLIGFPSVGKSTLLSVISNAKPKIADYQFTTLNPNLGVVELNPGQSYVVADMPGLIEGASQGVGLGMDFLRHIERTKVLVHVIDMAAEHGRDPFADFTTIMEELAAYNPRLLLRPMVVVANKMDQAQAQDHLNEFKVSLAAYCQAQGEEVALCQQPQIYEISAYQRQGVDDLLKAVYELVVKTDFIALEEEETVDEVHYQLEEEQAPFQLHRLNGDVWELTGEEIERLYAMTNTAHDESLARFARQLRAMGVDDALRAAGAQDGDLVLLSDFQFEFVE